MSGSLYVWFPAKEVGLKIKECRIVPDLEGSTPIQQNEQIVARSKLKFLKPAMFLGHDELVKVEDDGLVVRVQTDIDPITMSLTAINRFGGMTPSQVKISWMLYVQEGISERMMLGYWHGDEDTGESVSMTYDPSSNFGGRVHFVVTARTFAQAQDLLFRAIGGQLSPHVPVVC